MFGILGKIKWVMSKGVAIRDVVKEGKDVVDAVRVMEEKYKDLDDDAKAAWKEVREFVYAIQKVV